MSSGAPKQDKQLSQAGARGEQQAASCSTAGTAAAAAGPPPEQRQPQQPQQEQQHEAAAAQTGALPHMGVLLLLLLQQHWRGAFQQLAQQLSQGGPLAPAAAAPSEPALRRIAEELVDNPELARQLATVLAAAMLEQ